MSHAAADNNTASPKRKDARKGWYGYPLWPNQKEFYGLASRRRGTHFVIASAPGTGKTRIAAYFVSRVMKARRDAGIHTAAIFVAANAAQAKDQMREFGGDI
eukprot:4903918-Prymnesium_polylepis.1